jgi:hypothetical protein
MMLQSDNFQIDAAFTCASLFVPMNGPCLAVIFRGARDQSLSLRANVAFKNRVRGTASNSCVWWLNV